MKERTKESDERLLDALPDLLQAAERVMEMASLPPQEWDDEIDDLAFTGRINLLRAAIAKADQGADASLIVESPEMLRLLKACLGQVLAPGLAEAVRELVRRVEE
jgi:hypothetical protein